MVACEPVFLFCSFAQQTPRLNISCYETAVAWFYQKITVAFLESNDLATCGLLKFELCDHLSILLLKLHKKGEIIPSFFKGYWHFALYKS